MRRPISVEPTYLTYDKGTILVRSEAKVPYSTWDSRVRAFRAQALYYREIVEFLKKSELTEVKDGVVDVPPCPDLKCRRLTIRAAELGNRFTLMILDECVTGDTLVTMADGTTRPIKDINVGDLVLSAAKISRRVTHKWARGIRPIIQLKLSDGRVLCCTPEHQIFERNGLTQAV